LVADLLVDKYMSNIAVKFSAPTDKDPPLHCEFAAAGEFGSRRSGELQPLDKADSWRKLLVSVFGELKPLENGQSEVAAQCGAAEDLPARLTGCSREAGSANPQGNSNASATATEPTAPGTSFTSDAQFTTHHTPQRRSLVLPEKHGTLASARAPKRSDSKKTSNVEETGKLQAQTRIVSRERNGGEDLNPAQIAASACWAPALVQAEEPKLTAWKAEHPVAFSVVSVEHEIGEVPEKQILASAQLPEPSATYAVSAIANPQRASTGRIPGSAGAIEHSPAVKSHDEPSSPISWQKGFLPLSQDSEFSFPALKATNKQKGTNGTYSRTCSQDVKVDTGFRRSTGDPHRHGLMMPTHELRCDPRMDFCQDPSRYVPPEHTNYVYAYGGTTAASQLKNASEPAARRDFNEVLESGAGLKATQWISANTHRAEAGFRDPTFGWIGLRAELGPEGVSASVIPSSYSAAQALGVHIGALNAHLEQQRIQVHSLTLSVQNSHVDNSPGRGTQERDGDDARRRDRRRSSVDRAPEIGRVRDGTRQFSVPGRSVQFPDETARSVMHISVTA
jgi:hypothetical protein